MFTSALFTRNFLGLLSVAVLYSVFGAFFSHLAERGHLVSSPEDVGFGALLAVSIVAAIWANYPVFSDVQSDSVKLVARSLSISLAFVVFAFVGFLVNFTV